MTKLLSGNVWPEVRAVAAESRSRRAAIAYVSADCPIEFRRGDLLIADASDGCIRAGQTSAAFLARAFRSGVEVRSHQRLHAKVLLLDDQAVIGSANASLSSATLMEAAALISDSAFCRKVDSWLKQLARKSKRVDEAFLKRALSLPVDRASGRGVASRSSLLAAVRRGEDVVRDLVFTVATEVADITTTSARKAAISQNLPLPKGQHWTYFEDPFTHTAKRKVDELLGPSRAQICFDGKCNADGSFAKITGLDTTPCSFIGSVRVGGSLVSLFDTRKRAPVTLGGGDSRALCRILTAAFRARPDLWRKITDSPGQLFTADLLRKLVAIGEKHAVVSMKLPVDQ